MSQTYTQIFIHIVFTVRGRQNLIAKNHREELHKYITGIVQSRGHKMLAIFCMPDHVHLFIGHKPFMSISDLVRDIKAGSSKFINDSQWIKGRFEWQQGFGAFSYAKSQIDDVVNYILNQEEHHQRKKFRDEYIELLKEYDVVYNEKYLFE
ncbi:MAG: IS200/IS605 family transposase [Bacteroidota bacterium]